MLENFYSRKERVEKELCRVSPKGKAPQEVYGLISDFLQRGGKRFRPLLCLECARLAGGNDEDALQAAIAIELFHNFTLIHDDIEDDSKLRRAKPCLHILHGLPLAINAGDGLFMMVWQAALAMPQKNSLAAQKILLESFTSVLEGQAIELSWIRHNRWDISEEDYLHMIGGKTASLISSACHVGALLGGAGAKDCQKLKNYGYKIGLAFQIQDDLLNLVGEEEKYKKEIGGDIAEGKRTLMVIHCLPKLSANDGARMKKILGKSGASETEIKWCTKKMRECGSLDYACEFARRLVKEALVELEGTRDCQEWRDLTALAHYILSREE